MFSVAWFMFDLFGLWMMEKKKNKIPWKCTISNEHSQIDCRKAIYKNIVIYWSILIVIDWKVLLAFWITNN